MQGKFLEFGTTLWQRASNKESFLIRKKCIPVSDTNSKMTEEICIDNKIRLWKGNGRFKRNRQCMKTRIGRYSVKIERGGFSLIVNFNK